jgi:CheY-like chemotaxis protein
VIITMIVVTNTVRRILTVQRRGSPVNDFRRWRPYTSWTWVQNLHVCAAQVPASAAGWVFDFDRPGPERLRAGGQKITYVVVIENEPGILALLRDVLEGEGFDVIALTHGEQIHRLGPDHQPQLFVVDIMLPGMSGIEVARTLRSGGFSQTPMVAMSASPKHVKAASQSGLFQHVLAKPFDVSTFLQHVEQYVS